MLYRKENEMKGFAIIENDPKSEFFIITHGELEDGDLHGYNGVLIRKTIYKSIEKTLLHRLVLLLLNYLCKDVVTTERIRIS